MKHAVAVKDGTLVIEINDTRKWYEHIGIGFGTSKITVYIPQGEYGALSVESSTGDIEIAKELGFESIDISQRTGHVMNYASAAQAMKIRTTTGDIRVENVSAGSLELSVSTGKVTATGVRCEGDVSVSVSTGKAHLTDVACKNVRSEGGTGDIRLQNVIAAQSISVKRTTGDVIFEGADAAEIFVVTDTGDVKGSLLSDKVFITKTDTGRIQVPASVTGGRCEITTDTGDIRIAIQQ